ncbi:MAG: ornithine cyclodeaminase family protein [Maritimibacter sp.]|nr:ornithine cyclodeaminase family protein [Maritimibacter sp.]
MRLIRNEEVQAVAGTLDLGRALEAAFAAAGAGKTALQPRERISVDGVKLSTMAAILPAAGVAGAKIYTTIDGRFSFLVVLFDSETGKPLACIEADSVTALRTAAVTEIVAAALGPASPENLAVFGTGTQGRAHIAALARRFPLSEIRLVSRGDAAGFCEDMTATTGVPVRQVASRAAVDGAGIVVTATRATEPVFDGNALAPGAFVAAVGSTLPHAREIDGRTFARATTVIVEDMEQSFREAGGLILAEKDGDLDRSKVMTLGEAMADPRRARKTDDAIIVFESVGIALEDVAVAAEIFRALEV